MQCDTLSNRHDVEKTVATEVANDHPFSHRRIIKSVERHQRRSHVLNRDTALSGRDRTSDNQLLDSIPGQVNERAIVLCRHEWFGRIADREDGFLLPSRCSDGRAKEGCRIESCPRHELARTVIISGVDVGELLFRVVRQFLFGEPDFARRRGRRHRQPAWLPAPISRCFCGAHRGSGEGLSEREIAIFRTA